MSDRCLNLITVFLHVRFEYVVSQYSFQRLYMQYLIYSMQQSTLPIASYTKRRQQSTCIYMITKKTLNISLETRNLKETESLERPYFT